MKPACDTNGISADPAASVAAVAPRTGWAAQMTSARTRRLGKEFLWIGVGQAATVLGAMVGVRILTGVLSPEAYGQLALGMTVATFVNVVLLGPLSNGATRFYAPAREAGGLNGYFAAVRALVLRASGAVAIVAGVLCLVLLLTGHAKWIGLVLAAFCFALLSGYNSVLNGMQNAARQRAVVALHHGLLSWGRFLLAAGLVLWLGASSGLAMTGYCAATVLVLLSQWWFFRRILKPADTSEEATGLSPSRRWQHKILSYVWPFAAWGVPAWMQLASDRWALHAFSSMQDVGRYAVLYQLGYYPITTCTGLMVQLVSPIFFQRAGDASDPSRLQHVYGLNRRLTMAAILLTLVTAVVAYACHGAIFRCLVAPEYRAISWMLPGMVLAGGLFASGQFAVVSLLSGAQTHSLILPKVAVAVFGVLLNILGAACYGMVGVVTATVIAAAVYLLWILRLVGLQSKQTESDRRS